MIIENYRTEPQGLGYSWWANCPYIMHRYPHQTPARIKGTLKELRRGAAGLQLALQHCQPLKRPTWRFPMPPVLATHPITGTA